jgi:transglutaminase-like putative cysteine protease
MRMKMSESETVIQVEIESQKILFRLGDKIIKELAYEDDVFLEVPLDIIMNNEGFSPGRTYVFKVLDPFSYSLVEAHFEIIGEEEVFILGNRMRLWHIRTQTDYVIPLVTDEWVDEAGHIWRSDSQISFLTTTSIRMSKEKALEMTEDNFDIAFSTIIKPDTTIENPRRVKTARYRLIGISSEKIRNLPFDDGSQEILELKDRHAVIQTTSQVFREEDSLTLAAADRKVQEYLKPTSFCQSDDQEIVGLAHDIIGKEQNAWRAAKKIAEWVSQEIVANYDVGFASAKEVLNNREGDCSEHTVITVALCRAAGIPARAALGVMYGQDLFAYHMWPEVFVGRWIGLDAKWLAVDEQSGEYYTDATHIKFGRSDLDENMFKEMAQAISEILGKLNIEVIEYSHKK